MRRPSLFSSMLALCILVVNLTTIWGAVSRGTAGVPVSEYRLSGPGLVSTALYDAKGRMVRTLHAGERRSAGTHRLTWDGLDRDGRPVPVGKYTWKVLRTPGFRAEYVTSLGINPDSAPYDRWVGNHGGAASVAVDASGMYAAAQITETAPVLLKQSLEGKQRYWTRSRGDMTKGRYQGGISLASDGQGRLFMLQQNGYLQVIDATEGTLEATWDVLPEDLTRKGDGGPTWFVYEHGDRVAGADMADGFAARWTGHIEAPLSEMFTFSVYARGGVRLWIDGRQRIFGWNETTTRWEAEPISLQAGRRYPIQIDFYATHEHPACSLNWESPSLDRRRIPTEFLYPDPGPEVARKPDARPATKPFLAILAKNVKLSGTSPRASHAAGVTAVMARGT